MSNQIEMNRELAQLFVEYKIKNTKATWREITEELAPTLNHLSVKAYVGKYKSGKLGSQREGRPRVKKENTSLLGYSWLTKPWLGV